MLSDTRIRNIKPREKPYKLADEKGMYLLVAPNGGCYWRMDYRTNGKRKTLALGVYPDVSLKDARDKRDEARKLLANGTDPGETRKAQKAARAEDANTFEAVAREWFAKFSPNWVASHSDKIIRRLERDVFPWIGGRPIRDVSAPELLTVLRRIEDRGALETAHRAMQNCGQVFRYAIATGRAERDSSADLRGALPPVKERHYAAITDPKAIGELLCAIEGYRGSFVTRCALQLAPLIFLRPGELRKAEWVEFNLNAAEWNIPAGRMKMKDPHLVPLSRQACAILYELYPLTSFGRYVFPGARTNGRPMSENTVNAALRRLGFGKDEMTGHGFRAIARTILDETLEFRIDWIEHQLAHVVKDPNGRAYNRTAHLEGRRKMLQAWADYLDALKTGADVIPIHGVRNGVSA
jgi:integrase